MFYEILAIALGGALGSIFRFLVSNGFVDLLGKEFPYGTLAVNVIGSFLMGFLAILILNKIPQYNAPLAGFVLVGLLGGFTTFSTFSMDTFRLMFDGQYALGFINIITNIFVCLFATLLGYLVAMRVLGVDL